MELATVLSTETVDKSMLSKKRIFCCGQILREPITIRTLRAIITRTGKMRSLASQHRPFLTLT